MSGVPLLPIHPLKKNTRSEAETVPPASSRWMSMSVVWDTAPCPSLTQRPVPAAAPAATAASLARSVAVLAATVEIWA
jgi:hypothetical protein